MEIDFDTNPGGSFGYGNRRARRTESVKLQPVMATKRKRPYRSYGRRSYKRRRTGVSSAAVVRALAKANQSMGPFGVTDSAHYEKYGPSRAQMLANPGAARTQAQQYQRTLDRYWGPGDYWDSTIRGAESGAVVGGMAGALAGPEGIPIGAAVGGGIGGAIGLGTGLYDQYWGKGDYGKSVNQIVSGSDPVISVNRNSRSGDIIIAQTEFIGNLTASVTGTGVKTSEFQLESYEINPGLEKLFPFLSQLAQNYELYEWEGLMLCYKPNSGETSVSSNQLGKIVVATNYDPDCEDFRTTVEMQNYDYSNSCKPSEKLIHGVETAKPQGVTNMLFIRGGNSSKFKTVTDIGKLFIATEGIPITGAGPGAADVTTVVLGELHVTYRVRLSRAKLYNSLLGYGIASDRFWATTPAPAADSSWADDLVAHAKNHGTWSAVPGVLNTQIKFIANKQLVAGCYKCVCYFKLGNSSTLTVESVTATAGTGASIISQRSSNLGATAAYITAGASSETAMMVSFYVTVKNSRDAIPEVVMTLNSARTAAMGSTLRKFVVSQVSCALEDELF